MVKLLACIYRWLLALRYRVRLEGVELLKEQSVTLFLPNHQAVVDPQILFAHLLRYMNVSPLVTEAYCRIWILRPIFALLKVVSVPDLEKSRQGVHVVAGLYKQVIQALARGQHVLIYPAGQLANQGVERIYNKQSAWQVCRQLPEGTRVVGIRIQGLWGSMWSRARTGSTPAFGGTFLKGIFYVLVNGIFFLPRRQVKISFCDITENARQCARRSRKEFNDYLEAFYNVNGEEPVCFLKHYFYVPTSKKKSQDIMYKD